NHSGMGGNRQRPRAVLSPSDGETAGRRVAAGVHSGQNTKVRTPASGTPPPMPDSAREYPWSALLPTPEVRRKLWAQLADALEQYTGEVASRRVTPELAVER